MTQPHTNQSTSTPPPPARSLTPPQRGVIERLTAQFDIDEEKILFLNDADPNEPWIPPAELVSIARQAGGFNTVAENFDSYIEKLDQIVHSAQVVDARGRTFIRSGVATIGEKAANTQKDVDAHSLAGGRALSAALNSAGFNPFKSGTVVPIESAKRTVSDEAESRLVDLKAIHAIAREKGLIKSVDGVKNDSKYRAWLFEKFGTDTASRLDEPTRKSVINALNQLPDEEAMIA